MVEFLPFESFEATALVLSAEGDWLYNNVPFSNQRLKDLLYRSVVWDKDQNLYLIRNAVSTVALNYDDSPYFVEDLLLSADYDLQARLRGGTLASLEGHFVLCNEKNSLSIILKGKHRARLTRGCQQRLAEAVLDEDTLFLYGITVAVKSLDTWDEAAEYLKRTDRPF